MTTSTADAAIYKGNRGALDARLALALGDRDSARVRVQSGRDARPQVEVEAGEGRWVRLVSARNPEAEAAAWIERVTTLAPRDTVVLVGGGLGYALDLLETREPRPQVVIIEPDAALLHLMLARRDWRDWIDRGHLALVPGPRYDGLSTVARLMPGVDTAPVLVHPVLSRAWPERVRDALTALERLRFEAASNRQARQALAGQYLRHTLANAARVAREGDAARLTGLFVGTPAVVVAAGPSLDHNVHDLHLVRDRALIVACDTALRPLLTVGIEPQLVVAIDPSVANGCHLGALHEPRRTWLAGEASLHPAAYAHFERRTFSLRIAGHDPWPWLRTAGIDRLQVEAWGSVVTTAFDLTLRMGCDPVIFAGTDLAFTGGRPYCRGTTLEAQWASWVSGGDTYERAFALHRDRWPVVDTVDLHGGQTQTAPHLVAFRDWLIARAARAHPTRIINATGAGILHGPSLACASATATLATHPPLDLEAVQARLADAHRRAPESARLFAQIADLESRGWPWPEPWLAADPGAGARSFREALEGPEYAAWRLGRAPFTERTQHDHLHRHV